LEVPRNRTILIEIPEANEKPVRLVLALQIMMQDLALRGVGLNNPGMSGTNGCGRKGLNRLTFGDGARNSIWVFAKRGKALRLHEKP